MTDRSRFQGYVRWLRRHFPLSFPVTCRLLTPAAIKRINPEADFGVCEIYAHEPEKKLPQSFRISISDALNEDTTITTLIHEWAHALRSHLYLFGDPAAHDPLRALIEDEIWRKWHHE